jgi:hypothetical protein
MKLFELTVLALAAIVIALAAVVALGMSKAGEWVDEDE